MEDDVVIEQVLYLYQALGAKARALSEAVIRTDTGLGGISLSEAIIGVIVI